MQILRLPKSASIDGLNGRVINLMSNDVGKFDVALYSLHDLWKGPVQAVLLGYLIFREIGISGLVGMTFILCFIPIQSWIGKKSAQFRLNTTKRTDIRVRFMNEIIQGMQIIKMYTWENSFAKMIEHIRNKEMQAVKGTSYILALLLSFWAVSRVSIFLSLITYISVGNVITARKVFIVSSFFSILNESMVRLWPLAITHCAEGFISIRRLTEFLLLDEDKPKPFQKVVHMNGKGPKHDKNKIAEDEDLLIVRKPARLIQDNIARLLKQPGADNTGLFFECVTASWINSNGVKNTGIDSVNLKVSLCVLRTFI